METRFETTLNADKLTIAPIGKINATNAHLLTQETQNHTYTQLIIDCSQLEYISSAGLRVLFTLHQRLADDFTVIGVSRDVYEIFQMTGFTDIIKIERQMRQISITDCEIVGKGGNGTIYRINDDTILKLYLDTIDLPTIQRGAEVSKKAFACGVPTAITYDVVQCGSSYGVIFELLNADTIGGAVTKNPDKCEYYADMFAQCVKQAHNARVNHIGLPNAKDLWKQWTTRYQRYGLNETEIDQIKAFIDSLPDRDTLVHNDLHTNNVMIQNDECLMIDMNDIAYGHPMIDLAQLYYMVLVHPNNFFCGIAQDSRKPFWEKFVSSYFGKLTTIEKDELYKKLNFLIGFTPINAIGLMNILPEPIVPTMLRQLHEILLPQIPKYIGKIEL